MTISDALKAVQSYCSKLTTQEKDLWVKVKGPPSFSEIQVIPITGIELGEYIFDMDNEYNTYDFFKDNGILIFSCHLSSCGYDIEYYNHPYWG
jgi:hypothetical protein